MMRVALTLLVAAPLTLSKVAAGGMVSADEDEAGDAMDSMGASPKLSPCTWTSPRRRVSYTLCSAVSNVSQM